MTSRFMSFATGILTTVAVVSMPPSADAETMALTTTVQQIRVTSDAAFGGCMAQLAMSPSDVLPTCAPDWVTFSCTGEFTNVARAYRLFDQAQLAYSMEKTVTILVDDTRNHNGYCFATQIDLQ